MDRSPLYLAALASAAVPGLDPASVEAVPSEPGQQFDVAFVQDTQHRRWVVRAPRSQAAGAQMDVTVALLALLARRLPFAVPTPKGFAALKEGGRAAVYPYLPGQNIDFASLPPGPGLAAELGRTIAALHNADHQLFDEAGLPAYDADTYRTRRLSELDRAAATGHVPTALLVRWERQLEDVSLWRFAPTPTHGDLTGDQVLAVFDDEDDAATGRIRALTGWEDAKVADPADDFAALVVQARREALETVFEAYSHARVERPDKNLEVRARLAAEMQELTGLMAAVGGGDPAAVDRCAASLRRLDERLHAEEEADNDYRREASMRPARTDPVVVPPRLAADEEDDDVEVMFGRTAPEPHPDERGDRAEAGDERGDQAVARDVPEAGDGPEAGREAPRGDEDDGGDPRHEQSQTWSEARPAVTSTEVTGELEPIADPGPEYEPGYQPPR